VEREDGEVHGVGLPTDLPPSEGKGRSILVAGATGRQGGAVVRHLLRAGWSLRALTRDPTSPAARELQRLGAETVKGDMGNESALLSAMEGVHGVFSVQNYWEAGDVEEVRQGMNMANAALKSRVRHFVYSSIASAGTWSHIDHFETKSMVENHLRWIGLKRTILRPVLFMENYFSPEVWTGIAKGRLMSPLPRDRKVQLVSMEDVGAFAAAAFLHPEVFMKKIVEITGDELTMGEIAEAVGAASGRKVRFIRVPGILARPFMGKSLHHLYRWLGSKGFGVDIESLQRQYPEIPLTNFRACLERQNWAPDGHASSRGVQAVPS